MCEIEDLVAFFTIFQVRNTQRENIAVFNKDSQRKKDRNTRVSKLDSTMLTGFGIFFLIINRSVVFALEYSFTKSYFSGYDYCNAI